MHPTTSRKQWLAIRKWLLKKDKKLSDMREPLAAERRALPWVKIDKQYIFDAPEGKVTLADLLTDAAGPGGPLQPQRLLHERHRPILPRVVDFRPRRRGVLGIYRYLDATLKGRNGHGPCGTLAEWGARGRCPAAAA
jgi:predicted dithiol-disulfide oxidoreductase (DUF899 family)